MKNKMGLFFLLLFVCSTLFTTVYGQKQKRFPSKPIVAATQPKQLPTLTKSGTQGDGKLLTNANIIQMVKGGFGEVIILNAIQTNETQGVHFYFDSLSKKFLKTNLITINHRFGN